MIADSFNISVNILFSLKCGLTIKTLIRFVSRKELFWWVRLSCDVLNLPISVFHVLNITFVLVYLCGDICIC